MQTLEQHKAAYSELMTNKPRDGSFRSIAEFLNSNRKDLLLHDIQAERDIRRLALHRVRMAIPDLSREELLQFVEFLLTESRIRQEKRESLLTLVLAHIRTLSGSTDWVTGFSQMNKLMLAFAETVNPGKVTKCWACDNQPIKVFDATLFSSWFLWRMGEISGRLGLKRAAEFFKGRCLKKLENSPRHTPEGVQFFGQCISPRL